MTHFDVMCSVVLWLLGGFGLRWAGLDWSRAFGLSLFVVAAALVFAIVTP